MGGEAQLWSHIRDKDIPGHIQRIEDMLTPSIPDLNWCYEGKEYWIELKDQPTPVIRSTIVGLDIGQARWLLRRQKYGGNCRVLFRAGRYSQRQWYVFDKEFRMLVDSQPYETLRELAKHYWEGDFDWRFLL